MCRIWDERIMVRVFRLIGRGGGGGERRGKGAGSGQV